MPPPDGWRVVFEATRGGLVDRARLTLGASSAASDGLDVFDEPHPPAFPRRFVDLFTRHSQSDPGWSAQARALLRYRSEYGSPVGPESRAVDFFLETDAPGTFTLTWRITPDSDLAQHFATLRDVDGGTAVDLWTTPSYTLVAAPGIRHLRLELAPGRSAPPIAHDQTLALDEDTSLPIVLTATDLEGDPLSFNIVTAPSHGALPGLPPNVVYVPASDYFGPDQFTFKARDAQSDSNLATVAITVNGINDAPLALPQTLSTLEDTPLAITLVGTDVDGDALAFEIVQLPAHGTLTGIAPNLTYTPAPEFSGADSFGFRVSDGLAASAAATVSLSIVGVNDPPVAGFTVPGPERNVALWRNNLSSFFAGSQVVAFSSQFSTSFQPQNGIDDNSGTTGTRRPDSRRISRSRWCCLAARATASTACAWSTSAAGTPRDASSCASRTPPWIQPPSARSCRTSPTTTPACRTSFWAFPRRRASSSSWLWTTTAAPAAWESEAWS